MKISLLQPQISLGDFIKNKQTIIKLFEIALCESPDVIALPEMWNIGFFPHPLKHFADKDGHEVCHFLSSLAKKYGVNLVGGSVAIRRGEDYFNTSFVFDRHGKKIAAYDKIHLFSPAHENTFFQHGSQLTSFKLDGINCGLAICYDLRFPEQIRRLALQNIDILFLPAAWPVERLAHWQILNTARAIENQIFVAAINGVGTFQHFQLGGHSLLIDPWGKILRQATAEETMITADCNLDILREIRQQISIMQDRQPCDAFQTK